MDKIFGNLTGLKASHTKALARLYRRRVPVTQVATHELVSTMAQVAGEIGREVAVLVNRRGQLTAVSVASGGKLDLPPIKKREAVSRLCGLRCVVVHPRGGGLTREELVALAMDRLDLICAIEAEGGSIQHAEAWLAHLEPEPDADGNLWRAEAPMPLRAALEKLDVEAFLDDLERRFAEQVQTQAVDTGVETAILVAVATGKGDDADALAELTSLATTAGARVLKTVVQKREKPDPGTYLGSGKVHEVALLCRQLGATTVIVDAELSPSQQSNLEREMGVKVVDRPGLILDIFAQRAQTREGKLQVELAQLQYLLPRLSGAGTALSRLGGGIGTRGPGETKLEVDRRRIRDRITHLEAEVDVVKRQRSAQRRSRHRSGAVLVALVGYTNAGKSTLLNALTRSEVLAEDKLFATLDPTTRKLNLGRNGIDEAPEADVLLTDTVGFLQRLPHQLVAAFRATLEEVTEADVLLHVVDVASPHMPDQLRAVQEVLGELGAEGKPTVTVLNKVDRVQDPGALASALRDLPDAVAVSATGRKGFGELLDHLRVHVARVVRIRAEGASGQEVDGTDQGLTSREGASPEAVRGGITW